MKPFVGVFPSHVWANSLAVISGDQTLLACRAAAKGDFQNVGGLVVTMRIGY